MTKEELEEEAQKAYDSNDVWYKVNAQESTFKYGYIKGASPREKRIVKLEKENAELKTYIEKLEAQIAKLEKIGEE